MRVCRAFIADLDADAPRRALEYVSLPANEYNLIDPENVTHDASGGFVVDAGRQRIVSRDDRASRDGARRSRRDGSDACRRSSARKS